MSGARLLLGLAALAAMLSGVAAFRAGATGYRSLPVYGELKSFSLVDQNGESVSRESFLGTVHVFDFIYTRCTTVCPRLSARLAKLQQRTAGWPVHLVSISVDPAHDSPTILRAYGKTFGADFRRWRFLTGPSGAIQDLVVKGFFTAIDPRVADPQTIAHGESFVVTDPLGRIRAFRSELNDRDFDELVRVLAQLVDDKSERKNAKKLD